MVAEQIGVANVGLANTEAPFPSAFIARTWAASFPATRRLSQRR
jgi:hypothetical protein